MASIKCRCGRIVVIGDALKRQKGSRITCRQCWEAANKDYPEFLSGIFGNNRAR